MKNLQMLAADFKASMEQLVSWEPGHQARALSLLERFTTGQLDERTLRAVLGADGRQAAQRAPTPRAAVLRLKGVLTPDESIFSFLGIGTSLRAFASELRAAASDPGIANIGIIIDSPGGHVQMVPEVASLMRTTRAKKPIVSAISGTCASAAYWVASNSTRIEATPSAQIGSIGVFAQRVSIARALEQSGVDITTVSAGKYKSEGVVETAVTDAELAALQARVDESYANFVNDVALGRGVSASTVRSGFGEGRILSAPEALRQRMIDSVSLAEDTIARTAAGAVQVPQSATAWSNQVSRELFELDLPPGSSASNGTLRQQLELERLAMEIAFL